MRSPKVVPFPRGFASLPHSRLSDSQKRMIDELFARLQAEKILAPASTCASIRNIDRATRQLAHAAQAALSAVDEARTAAGLDLL